MIDWFTVGAQIFNFLVLVYLLKRFLYKPVIKAMDERESRIAARLEEARKREEEAVQERENYEEKNRDLDRRRQTLLNDMKEAVEVEKKERLGQVRKQIEAVRSDWHEALEREKDSFLHDLRERAGRHTYAVARRALGDLANVDLESHIIRVFVDHLRSLTEEEQVALQQAFQASRSGFKVMSAFEIPQQASQEIADALKPYLSEPPDLQFQISPEVICGIELRVHGHKIAWSLRDYLEGLEAVLTETLTGGLNRRGERSQGHLKEKENDSQGRAGGALEEA